MFSLSWELRYLPLEVLRLGAGGLVERLEQLEQLVNEVCTRPPVLLASHGYQFTSRQDQEFSICNLSLEGVTEGMQTFSSAIAKVREILEKSAIFCGIYECR